MTGTVVQKPRPVGWTSGEQDGTSRDGRGAQKRLESNQWPMQSIGDFTLVRERGWRTGIRFELDDVKGLAFIHLLQTILCSSSLSLEQGVLFSALLAVLFYAENGLKVQLIKSVCRERGVPIENSKDSIEQSVSPAAPFETNRL